jgi:plastocyanin
MSGDVQAIDFAFSPLNLTITQGSTVSWVNTGVALHTATARDGSFDSGFLNTGDSYSKRFDEPGTFEYFCTLHPDMIGSIVVTGADGTAPLPVTDPALIEPIESPPGDINMLDFVFDPVTMTVPVGGSVTWVNQGAALHTATAEDGSFDSGFLATGESFTMAFESAGVYDYLCIIHPAMVGTIVVDPDAPAQGATDQVVNSPADPQPAATQSAPGSEPAAGVATVDVIFIVIFAMVGLGFLRNLIPAFIGRTRTP